MEKSLRLLRIGFPTQLAVVVVCLLRPPAHYIEKHKAQGKQMNLRAYGVEKTGAKAYLDSKKRKDLGEKVDSSDINDDEIVAALFRLHGADS